MEKLDALPWAGSLTFSSYGVLLGVRANLPKILRLLPEYLPLGSVPRRAASVSRLYSLLTTSTGKNQRSSSKHVLYADSSKIAESADLNEVLKRFESHAELYIAEVNLRRVFVHAGVVGWRGSAIVLPGRSLAGKTTLVAELLRIGATYYSDEYAVLDRRGRVYPYARPLRIRDPRAGRARNCAVEAWGGVTGEKALPISLIVASQFKKNAQFKPRQLSAGQAIQVLLANTVSARHRPRAALATLKQAVLRAKVFQSMRGEAREAVNFMLQQSNPRGRHEPRGRHAAQ